jgi:hypothetical protein
MTDSTRSYKIIIGIMAVALGVVTAMWLTSKGGGGEDVAGKLNRLSGDLTDCKTQRGDLKERVATLEAQLKQAQEQANAPNVVNGTTITANVKNGAPGGPTLPMDQVKKVIAQSTGGLKTCYERALKRDSGLQLQPIHVTFRFYIHPAGNTGETSLATDTHIDPQLIECFKQAIGRWRFPSFGGQPIPIELPLPFQPVGGK